MSTPDRPERFQARMTLYDTTPNKYRYKAYPRRNGARPIVSDLYLDIGVIGSEPPQAITVEVTIPDPFTRDD